MPRHLLPTRTLFLAAGLATFTAAQVLAEGGGRDPVDLTVAAAATQAVELTPEEQTEVRDANARVMSQIGKDALKGGISGKGYTDILTKSVIGLFF